MSPVAGLFLTLFGLHVVEGLLWIRRSASAFVRGWGRHRAIDTLGPYGNAEHCLLLLSPWPPFSEITVSEAWPLVFGEETLWRLPLERGRRDRPITGSLPQRDRAAATAAHATGKELHVGPRLALTSSAAAARQLAALVRRWAEAAPEARAAVVQAALAQRFDRTALRARIDQVERSARVLRVLSHLASLVLFGGAYAFFFVPSAAVEWPIVAAIIATLQLATWLEFARVHRRLFPGMSGDLATKLFLMVLSFPAAARARAWIARDALAAFHPLAVGEALMDRGRFLRWAGPRWRDLAYPLAPDPEPVRAAATRARAELIAAYRAFFAEIDVDPQTLERGPEGAAVYCPRCHAELTHPEGECPDCPGVTRVRAA